MSKGEARVGRGEGRWEAAEHWRTGPGIVYQGACFDSLVITAVAG